MAQRNSKWRQPAAVGLTTSLHVLIFPQSCLPALASAYHSVCLGHWVPALVQRETPLPWREDEDAGREAACCLPRAMQCAFLEVSSPSAEWFPSLLPFSVIPLNSQEAGALGRFQRTWLWLCVLKTHLNMLSLFRAVLRAMGVSR